MFSAPLNRPPVVNNACSKAVVVAAATTSTTTTSTAATTTVAKLEEVVLKQCGMVGVGVNQDLFASNSTVQSVRSRLNGKK